MQMLQKVHEAKTGLLS